jgi:hypothetical protein
VQVVPAQENVGKITRPPLMTLPCVLDEAVSSVSLRLKAHIQEFLPAISETRIVPVVPWKRVTVMEYVPPSAQSVSVIVNWGCWNPWFRYGGMYTSIRISSGYTGVPSGLYVCGSEPETRTRPSGRRVASEWYSLATIVLFRMDMRCPIGWDGSYRMALRLGSLASPNPATPW